MEKEKPANFCGGTAGFDWRKDNEEDPDFKAWTCPKCGRDNNPHPSQVCLTCGTPKPVDPIPSTCPVCGEQYE